MVTGMKQSTTEAERSPPSNVNVKNEWKYTSTTGCMVRLLNAWISGRPRKRCTKLSRPAVEATKPPSQQVPGRLSPMVEAAVAWICYSSPSSAKFQIKWWYISDFPYAFVITDVSPSILGVIEFRTFANYWCNFLLHHVLPKALLISCFHQNLLCIPLHSHARPMLRLHCVLIWLIIVIILRRNKLRRIFWSCTL
jgi:hypothetical protein